MRKRSQKLKDARALVQADGFTVVRAIHDCFGDDDPRVDGIIRYLQQEMDRAWVRSIESLEAKERRDGYDHAG